MKTYILTIFSVIIAVPINSFAQNIICPSVNEIKNHQFHQWIPLYIDNEELASDLDVAKFQSHVKQFLIARWNKDYLESGHCFYQGNDPILSKIVFAQDAWRPEQNIEWIWLKENALAECHTCHVEDCAFIF